MDNIIVQRTSYDINENINTCNHPKDMSDMEAAGLDYDTELKKTNLMNYAEIIKYPIEWTYTFTPAEMLELKKCAVTCTISGNIDAHRDVLEPIINRLESQWCDGRWFFRFNGRSPKDGAIEFPVLTPRHVITKIITSKRGFTSLIDGEDTIYFVKYVDNWDRKREFRVFIYKQQVTAISQYTYDKCILSGKSSAFAKEIGLKIKTYLEKEVLPIVCAAIGTNNVVCDIYVNEDSSLRIIEFNSFGYWLAAGSALFNWLTDRELLYNQKGLTYLRFRK